MPTKVSRDFVRESASKRAWTGPVIDLGAGGYAPHYRDIFNGHEYIQLDMKPEPKGITSIVADICNMPAVKSETYGVVLLTETLEHIYSPERAFREAARILKVGGIFICTTVACWPIHRHPKDYWRFLPDGLDHLCKITKMIPYHVLLDSKDGATNSHCCIAAVKAKIIPRE